MPREDYEERREARIERLDARAEKAQQASDSAFDRARGATAGIPFGQPILVGHHSEKRHRAALKRSDNAMSRGCEESDKAKDLRGRAFAAEANTSVSSDDPDAIVKLKEKVAALEADRDHMKAVNKAYRAFKKKPESLEKANLHTDAKEVIRTFKPEYSWQKGPYESYQLSNIGATIRSTKKRIEALKIEFEAEDVTEMIGGVRVEENTELNRVLVSFDRPPPAKLKEVSKAMRSHGLRWTPSETSWTALLNNGSRYKAREAARVVDAILGQ